SALDAAVVGAAPAAGAAVPAGAMQLKSGLDALSAGDLARARVVRDNLPVDSLDSRILMWAIAVSGGAGVPSGEIADAALKLGGWPGMATLRRNSERALYREN